MERRAILLALAAAPLARPCASARAAETGSVLTVEGAVAADALGPTVVHEHVLVDFVGAASIAPGRYDADEAFRVILPHLVELRERGCLSLFEATPAYLGRDPALLRRLARASGLRIVTNTGYYGAAADKFVPAHAYRETAGQLAKRWTGEFRRGIDGTGIRPGFLKLGVDAGPLSEIDRKIVEAGARCHLETGLTIAVHTGDGRAALAILETLRGLGVAPEAYVWVHAQNEKDRATRDWVARQGAWVELDGISGDSLAEHVDAVVDLKRRGLLSQVLVSHDAGWFHVGEHSGGAYRPHTLVFDAFVPALRARGFTGGDVRALLEVNPGRAFALRVRRLAPGRAG